MGGLLSVSRQLPTTSSRTITADTAVASKSPAKFPSRNSQLTRPRSVKFSLSPDSAFPANPSCRGSRASSSGELSDAIASSGQSPSPLLKSPVQRFVDDVTMNFEAYKSIEDLFTTPRSRSASPFVGSRLSPVVPRMINVNKTVIVKKRRSTKRKMSLWKYYTRKHLGNQIPADVVPMKNS